MFKHTLGYILERALIERYVGYEKRFHPRRHRLSKEECAKLKAVIRLRMSREDYRCRLPDVRVYYTGKLNYKGLSDRGKPVYRLRLRRELIRLVPPGTKGKFIFFGKRTVVWR